MSAIHAITCPVRSWWNKRRWHMPYWRDDRTAKMLCIAHLGCPRCGRGAR